jgi:hypothetical protein
MICAAVTQGDRHFDCATGPPAFFHQRTAPLVSETLLEEGPVDLFLIFLAVFIAGFVSAYYASDRLLKRRQLLTTEPERAHHR